MNTKWWNIKTRLLFLLCLLFSLPSSLEGQTRYDKRIHYYRETWEKLIPTHSKIQFAGEMGLLSVGTGWDYGKKNQWETDIFLGFLPKYDSEHFKITFTLKQNYIPWSINLKKGFSLEPLACGFYFNTIFNDEFWTSEPERYPHGYYGFSSKIRANIFLGQRITYNIDPERRYTAKEISFYYELSTNDIYLISAVGNKYLRPKDYLRLSFGLMLQWL